MYNSTLFPLQQYKIKKYGVPISLLAMLLLVLKKIVALHSNIITFGNLDERRLFTLMLIVGLIMVAFSKEEIDDDRVQKLRGKASQAGFMFLIIIMATFSFVLSQRSPVSAATGEDISLIALLGLSLYLMLFYIGLLFDSKLSSEKDSRVGNIKETRTYFILYSIFGAITAALLIIL
jgi:hypothetical protein